MSEAILKHCRVGLVVEVNGKRGTVMEVADKVKVKFTTGEFGFFEDGEIKLITDDTRLKESSDNEINKDKYTTACPYCSGRIPKDQDICPECGYIKKTIKEFDDDEIDKMLQKAENNPWAICHGQGLTGDKFERCVQHVKERMGKMKKGHDIMHPTNEQPDPMAQAKRQ